MVAWRKAKFLDLVGVREPIIAAPMAGAAGVELCVAAIAGGALGSLPCALLNPLEVRSQVDKVRSSVSGPLNLNFFCHDMAHEVDDTAWRRLLHSYYAEFAVEPDDGAASPPLRLPFDDRMCAAVEEVRPEVVSFHFGLPEQRLMDRVKAAGAIIFSSATTVEEAVWLEKRGVDAIIAQGFEAGGHSGRFLGSDPDEAIGLFALLPQIVDAVRIPVIAAGGIGDGRGIAASLILGASAVQLGTAYLHTPEARINDVHRAKLRDGRTLFTNLFTGGLARGVRTRLTDDLGPVRAEAPPYPFASAALTELRTAAEKQRIYDFGPMWAGQAARLGQSLPAAELTRKLAGEALAILHCRG